RPSVAASDPRVLPPARVLRKAGHLHALPHQEGLTTRTRVRPVRFAPQTGTGREGREGCRRIREATRRRPHSGSGSFHAAFVRLREAFGYAQPSAA
ncbi:hypothetical protein AAVH_41487, partial [Aphelenchoides avenae]